eukprot:2629731-Prymnesium_polylepis.1
MVDAHERAAIEAAMAEFPHLYHTLFSNKAFAGGEGKGTVRKKIYYIYFLEEVYLHGEGAGFDGGFGADVSGSSAAAGGAGALAGSALEPPMDSSAAAGAAASVSAGSSHGQEQRGEAAGAGKAAELGPARQAAGTSRSGRS